MTTGKRKVWWGDFRRPPIRRSIRKGQSPCCRWRRSSSTGRICRFQPTRRSCKGMLETVIARLPDNLDIRILPVQAVGKSNEHLHAPGTLTLPAATLIEAWTELGASVARAGVRKLVVVNSHGGNEEIMGIVTRELRVRFGMLAVKTSWQRFGRPDGCTAILEDRHGIHGGDVETSLMLHFRPDLVDMTKAENFRLQRRPRRAGIRAVAPDRHACLRLDRHRSQSARRGRRRRHRDGRKGPLTAEHQADGFVRLLQDVRKAKLADGWRKRSLSAGTVVARRSVERERHALESVRAAADRPRSPRPCGPCRPSIASASAIRRGLGVADRRQRAQRLGKFRLVARRRQRGGDDVGRRGRAADAGIAIDHQRPGAVPALRRNRAACAHGLRPAASCPPAPRRCRAATARDGSARQIAAGRVIAVPAASSESEPLGLRGRDGFLDFRQRTDIDHARLILGA